MIYVMKIASKEFEAIRQGYLKFVTYYGKGDFARQGDHVALHDYTGYRGGMPTGRCMLMEVTGVEKIVGAPETVVLSLDPCVVGVGSWEKFAQVLGTGEEE